MKIHTYSYCSLRRVKVLRYPDGEFNPEQTRRRKGRLDMELEVENLRIFFKKNYGYMCV